MLISKSIIVGSDVQPISNYYRSNFTDLYGHLIQNIVGEKLFLKFLYWGSTSNYCSFKFLGTIYVVCSHLLICTFFFTFLLCHCDYCINLLWVALCSIHLAWYFCSSKHINVLQSLKVNCCANGYVIGFQWRSLWVSFFWFFIAREERFVF